MPTNGIYVVPERVERDGILIAFSGMRMTVAEAVAKGIYDEPNENDEKPEKKPASKTAKKKA